MPLGPGLPRFSLLSLGLTTWALSPGTGCLPTWGIGAQLGMDRQIEGLAQLGAPQSCGVKVCECTRAVGSCGGGERKRRGEEGKGGRQRERQERREERYQNRERGKREGGRQRGVRESRERGESKGGKEGKSEWGGEGAKGGGGGRRPTGVPVPLTVIKDIDVLRRQPVFAQVKGNPMLVMTRSPRPPCPLPAWSRDLGGLGGGVWSGETPIQG